MDILIKDIKQIPKYMLAKIKRIDLKINKDQTAQRRFYAYLACWKKQLVKVTVAVRTKYNRWQCKQVAVHFLNSKNSYIKDLIFYPVGGYQVGWYDLGFDKKEKFYEDGQWYENDTKLFDPYDPVVNLDFLERFPKYKYSEYKSIPTANILKILEVSRYEDGKDLNIGTIDENKREFFLRAVKKGQPTYALLDNYRPFPTIF